MIGSKTTVLNPKTNFLSYNNELSVRGDLRELLENVGRGGRRVSGTLFHVRGPVILVLGLTLFLYLIAPAYGSSSYSPGVKPGDTITYGQIRASWKSNTGSFSPVKDFLNTSSIVITVQNVAGTSVTGQVTFSYLNGTTRSLVLVEDVQSGIGNMSSSIEWIIAGSLAAPDPIYESSSAPTIDQTKQSTFAGSARTVNIINSTQPEPGGFCRFQRVWDQNTGLLLGFALNYTVSNANYHVSASASAQVTQTNLSLRPEQMGTLVLPTSLGLILLTSLIGSGSALAVHVTRRRETRR
jgi:hypothetical protein